MLKSRSTIKYITKKIIRLVTLYLAVMIVTFILMELSPIDPVTAYVGTSTKVGAKQRALIAEKWGLNDPPLLRFGSWFSNMLKGDWGTSLIYRRPVMEVIGQKFAASLSLMATAWILSGIIGYALGVIAGVKRGKLADKIISVYCHVLIATPTFWIGILAIMIFCVKLGWFPVGLSVAIGVVESEAGLASNLYHMILPAITLSFVGIASLCMHTREKTIEVLNSDYVLFARARGEKERSIVRNHVLRNVSLPAITLQFLSFNELFGGAVFVEQVFSYPGLGNAAVLAGLRGDIPLLMGITLISVLFVFTGNAIADLLYQIVDPRIREGGARKC